MDRLPLRVAVSFTYNVERNVVAPLTSNRTQCGGISHIRVSDNVVASSTSNVELYRCGFSHS